MKLTPYRCDRCGKEFRIGEDETVHTLVLSSREEVIAKDLCDDCFYVLKMVQGGKQVQRFDQLADKLSDKASA